MTEQSAPFYQKLSFNLISIGLITLALYFGHQLILPLLFALLLATLLLPVTKYFASKKLPKALTIIIPLLLAIALIGGIIYLLSARVLTFIDDLPSLQDRIDEVGLSFQKWVRQSIDMTIRKQNVYVKQAVDNLKEKAPQIAGVTVGSIKGFLTYAALIPIYTYLILYYRSVIKKFLVRMFRNGSEENVTEILTESVVISRYFVTGLLIETVIVFALNTTGLMILGVKYAVFLALLGALLNLIPYVGMLTANILCMLITLISSDSTNDVVWVGVILAVVQFIDHNFSMPFIVGTRVRINALVIILGVFIGGALCGIPGMFLAIPAIAVCKVICDRVEELKPWGELLGDGSVETPKEKKKLEELLIDNKAT